MGRAIALGQDDRWSGFVRAAVVAAVAAMVLVAAGTDYPPATGWSAGRTAGVTTLAWVAYALLHELTHGLALRLLAGARPRYAVRPGSLTTGSDALLTRPVAVAVSLAPVVVWSAILVAVLAWGPRELAVSAYVVLGLNLAGSTGDLVQALAVGRLPRGSLVRDDGDAATAFVPTA